MAEDLLTPSNTLVKVRWKEPYASEGLNKKLNGLVPHGVIRGGRLGTSALNSTVVVEVDPDSGDSIYSVVDANGHQLTFRQTTNVSLDLDTGTLPGTTAYIGLDVNYSTSTATTVRWRGYSAAEIDADPTIVCLGSAEVPGVAAVIPEGDISGDRRTDGGMAISSGMRPWRQVVQNPSFEGAEVSVAALDTSSEHPGWILQGGSFGTTLLATPGSTPASQPRSGNNNLYFRGAAAADGFLASPKASYRVSPGQMVKASVWVRGDTVTLGGGGTSRVGIRFIARQWDGTLVAAGAPWSSGSYYIVEDGTVITGTFDYLEISGVVKMPSDAAFLTVQLIAEDTASITGDIGFDDFRVWIEGGPPQTLYDLEDDVVGNEVITPGLVVSPYVNQDSVVDPEVLFQRAVRLICSDATSGGLEYSWEPVKAAVTSWLMSMPKGRLRLGNSLVSTAAEGIIPRISTDLPIYTNAQYVLLWEMNTLGVGDNVRLYGTDRTNVANPAVATRTGEAWVITHNAEWTGTQWQYDSSLQAAQRFEFGANGFYFSQKESGGTSPWDDADWEDNTEAYRYFGVQRGTDGVARITANDAYLQILNGGASGGTNPTAGASVLKNTLYGKTILKGWRTFNLSGGSASGGDGVNINLGTVATDMTLTFDQGMANQLYCVVSGIVGSSTAGYFVPVAKNIQLASFDLQFFEVLANPTNTITFKSATAVNGSFAVAVYGRQAS